MRKRFYALLIFLFTFFAVFRCFSAVETGSDSGSTAVPLVKFKEWKVGRSDEGTNKDDAVHLSFITSTETSCRFSASVGYQGGSQAPNTSPIDPSTVKWGVVDASHEMKLDTSSVKKNWTGPDPSKFDAKTSFNVVAKLTVPKFNRNTSCTEVNDANRSKRNPVHRGGTKMSFKLKFSANTKAGGKVEVVLSLKADDKDQIRQEYVDFNRPIPTRENDSAKLTKWADENTYDFGHYKTMMDHGLDDYFQDWVDAMNKIYRKGKTPLKKSDFLLNSGYRNPHHNHRHSGSTGLSSHMYGYALDVNGRDIDGVSGADQQKMVNAALAKKKVGGAGARHSQRYPNKSHVHADWAPNSPKKWAERKKTADDPPSFALPTKTDTKTAPKTTLRPVFSPASGSSYTAVAGGTHTGEVRSDAAIYGAYLYIDGEYVKWVWGSKTAKSLLLSYTFGSDAVGSYKMEAYVYPWNGNTYGDYTYYSYTVSVSGSVPGVPVLSAVGGNGSVDLSWVAPEDGGSAITHYEYRYGVGASVEESDYSDWTSTGSTDTSHTVSPLTNGSYHLFQVRAVNAIGSGAASIASGVTPVAPSAPPTPTAAPGVPTGLTSTVSNGTVTLNWNAPTDTGVVLTGINIV